ncbi:MAG: SDR family oxidoreductase [Anaerolineae bacterium]|nr:SDR family oxidoreductase [Anaerolineae bacterium]
MTALLRKQVALVTGSTSGIGRAIAIRLAQEGARVMVTGRRAEWGERVVDEIRASGGTAQFLAADISRGEDVRRLVEQTVATLGGLDLVVNNAGLIPRRADGSSPDGPLHLTEEAYWDELYQISLKSVYWTAKYAIPHLLSSQHASIIHISSNVALQGFGVDVYSAIKGALVSLTRSMAASYAHRIRVNCICPGVILVERNSPMWDTHPEMYEQYARGSFTRVGKPDDIADCVAYLAEAEFVSGAVMVVDGGASVKAPPLPSPAR